MTKNSGSVEKSTTVDRLRYRKQRIGNNMPKKVLHRSTRRNHRIGRCLAEPSRPGHARSLRKILPGVTYGHNHAGNTSSCPAHLRLPLFLMGVLKRTHVVLVAPRFGADAVVLQRPKSPVGAEVCGRLLLKDLGSATATVGARNASIFP